MNNSSNREKEFRKIKSLYFLYEINEDGTVIRNIKSKKQLKIKLDFHHSEKGYYYVWTCIKHKVQRHAIHKLVAECWLGEKPIGYEIDHIDRNSHNNHYSNLRYVTYSEQMKNRILSNRIINNIRYNSPISKRIMIKKNNINLIFPSHTQAAKFIAEEYNKREGTIRDKLKKRRKKIYDYNIIYSFAETRHVDSTE